MMYTQLNIGKTKHFRQYNQSILFCIFIPFHTSLFNEFNLILLYKLTEVNFNWIGSESPVAETSYKTNILNLFVGSNGDCSQLIKQTMSFNYTVINHHLYAFYYTK